MFEVISVAGWKKVDKIDGQEMKEEEVQALFNMIDTDLSGVLTKKVWILDIRKHEFLCSVTGSHESCSAD